jgi:hypothetical protein
MWSSKKRVFSFCTNSGAKVVVKVFSAYKFDNRVLEYMTAFEVVNVWVTSVDVGRLPELFLDLASTNI